MASRYAIYQALQLLGISAPPLSASVLPLQAARCISSSAFCLRPDVIVPSMGESIKEGVIATVHKQARQPVREDEVIAQIETDKVTIDIKAPAAGVLQQLHIKPSDLVVAGQVVAVVGAAGPVAPVTPAASKADAGISEQASTSGRRAAIHFPPRFTVAGLRISDLPETEYAAAVAATDVAGSHIAPHLEQGSVQLLTPVSAAPATTQYPLPAAKAAPPPFTKNKLQYVTRPDGRGGPPRRPLTERELDMINLGGVY
ncbi:hypothetical protein Vafri_817 [Volvox africanus]|nr:hypothetical protein Vafri_817 [Volvox africanus]